MRLEINFETSREILPLKFHERLGPHCTIAKGFAERKRQTSKKAENTGDLWRWRVKTLIPSGFSTVYVGTAVGRVEILRASLSDALRITVRSRPI
jgi:hypothetical protein